MILFYKADGYDGYLSQSYIAPFVAENKTFKTAEHYMMYKKAILFRDEFSAESILKQESAELTRELGRKIKNFDQVIWDKSKYEIVFKANYLKFSQHPELKKQLLDTGDKLLANADPDDRIWGIGLSESQKALNRRNWRGDNLLGIALMKVREALK